MKQTSCAYELPCGDSPTRGFQAPGDPNKYPEDGKLPARPNLDAVSELSSSVFNDGYMFRL